MGYLHGIEVKESLTGVKGASSPSTAVVGLVGTAPIFLGGSPPPIGKPVLVTNDREAAAFGPAVPGYTIPAALRAIFSYGSARVVVINVFDPERHMRAVSNEQVRMGADGQAKLANAGVKDLSLIMGGADLTEGADYTLDAATGTVRRAKGGSIPPGGAQLAANYRCADFTSVTPQDVIGGADDAGLRHGIAAFVDAATLLGSKPRIFIAPGYPIGSSVGAALAAEAERLPAGYGHAYLDVPPAATVGQVVAGRGGEGPISISTSSQRVVICYPRVMVMDPATEAPAAEPLSQHLAGLACAVDAMEGIWVSPSSHALAGVVGLETPIQWAMGDENCEANRLNEVGIVTTIRPPNMGFIVWGNRSAAWPSETHPVNFISVRATADYLHEVAVRALMSYQDRPLTQPILNSAREDVLAVISGLVRRGALLGGSFSWPPEDNSIAELSMGHITYHLSFLPPPPIDSVTVKARIDTTWLGTLKGE